MRMASLAERTAALAEQFVSILEQSAVRGDSERRLSTARSERAVAEEARRRAQVLRGPGPGARQLEPVPGTGGSAPVRPVSTRHRGPGRPARGAQKAVAPPPQAQARPVSLDRAGLAQRCREAFERAAITHEHAALVHARAASFLERYGDTARAEHHRAEADREALRAKADRDRAANPPIWALGGSGPPDRRGRPDRDDAPDGSDR